MWAKLPITSLTPFTFQDYPDHTACILWFSGCNMACAYCHNPELVMGTLKRLAPEKIEAFLASRKGLLEGVVLSGGECTLSPELPDFCAYLKSMDFKVKIDTNGTRPDRLNSIIQSHNVDYIALDFKAPPERFHAVAKLDAWPLFDKSLRLMCGSKVPFELRTTVHADLLDLDDLEWMGDYLETVGYTGTLFIQPYRHGKNLGGLSRPKSRVDTSLLRSRPFRVSVREAVST